MRLTLHTDYSLRVLMYLALHDEGFDNVQAIAKAYDISWHHLTKVVHALVRRGYVDSIRGHGGGIRLRRAPDRIRIGDVVRDMETDFELVECFARGSRCAIGPCCPLQDIFGKALEAFHRVLDEYTLQDLLVPQAPLRRLLSLQ